VRDVIAGGHERQAGNIFRIYLGEANGRHQSVADAFPSDRFLHSVPPLRM
jgi:hypothetical protein